MIATPSTKTRMPSSARAVKVNVPAAKVNWPVHRAEKLSTGRPAGPPAPKSWLTAVSQAVRVAGAVSVTLLKYCAKNWPVGQLPPAGFTVNVRALDVWPSGFLTLTGTAPAAAMSAAAMAVVTRVALTKVVARDAPFQSTLVPVTKLAPSTVSVNAGPPAVALLGVSAVTVGAGAVAPVQLTWATASPPRS